MARNISSPGPSYKKMLAQSTPPLLTFRVKLFKKSTMLTLDYVLQSLLHCLLYERYFKQETISDQSINKEELTFFLIYSA